MVNVALILIYALLIFELGANAALHGKSKNSTYNFWTTLFMQAVVMLLIWWALGWRFI